MEKHSSGFNEHDVLHHLKHYLPAQAPLKDFIHHNTLHAFQNIKFEQAIRNASEILGYRVSLSLAEFRALYAEKRIREDVLDRIIVEKVGEDEFAKWKDNVLAKEYNLISTPRIGLLRSNWKKLYQIDLNSLVHPILFRILCSYLDQGISIWSFPEKEMSFLDAIRTMEKDSYSSLFRSKRARSLLLEGNSEIKNLLKILVGDDSLYEDYLYDQQFAHQGWSGMVSTIEDQPSTLLDFRKLSFRDLVYFELLLEIDALDFSFGEIWSPLGIKLEIKPTPLFAEVKPTELSQVKTIFQEAFEWSFYDEVLAGIKLEKVINYPDNTKSFQALFCIDDRECSIRRYLEKFDPNCETFGTPGFMGAEFYYQPEGGKFYTKVCPAPVTPKFLIKGYGNAEKLERDAHFTKHSHSFYTGWLISQTLGFWSAVKLFINIFRPSMSPATASSFKHMHRQSSLTIENKNKDDVENGLQIGFNVDEMVVRVEGLLKSIGLVKNFAPLIYICGHGSSTINNPHYAAYDCGACSGRAGSVNARVFAYMANHLKVREILASHGIVIPSSTQFVGTLHDTTRDEIAFYDLEALSQSNNANHNSVKKVFEKSLDYNAKERSRRFVSVNTKKSAAKIHEEIKVRSVSLFEPRPELNHATNALCIIGRRSLTRGLFLDRRSFLNSYDYAIDPEGDLLFNVMKPVGPVCGGINLEYFFSKVDNQKLGAGTKLPHNVMGLIGVANGIDGDLRPGLPSQMIEVHDPIRLLVIVEHFPEIVLRTIKRLPEMYEWYINEWVNIVAVNPETRAEFVFKNGAFTPYLPLKQSLDTVSDVLSLVESSEENFPVYLIS